MEKPVISNGGNAEKPIRCRAAVCRAAGEPLEITYVHVAAPQPFEVRIRIICTSLCHSDLTFWRMKDFPGIFPRILGHEAYGVVESVGPGVDEMGPGDTVVPVFQAQCSTCEGCRSEKGNACDTFPLWPHTGMPRDGSPRFSDDQGHPIYHSLCVSSFSEYTVVDVAHVIKVDPTLPPAIACLLSCGASTGVGATWRAANVEEGSVVAIFGLGAVGLAVAEGARLRRAKRIIGVDLNPQKFEIGKKFGITDFVNPKDIGEKPVNEVIEQMTNGGVDYCFECVGLASVMSDAYRSCKKGYGKMIILGVEMNGAPLTINAGEMLLGRSILGSSFGGIKPKTDIPVLAKKCLNKELELGKFITHEIGFEEINTAFDLLNQGKSLRCLIWMDR